jgi:ATP-dependent DNA ligase
MDTAFNCCHEMPSTAPAGFATAVTAGEVVVFDGEGVSRFQLLQNKGG